MKSRLVIYPKVALNFSVSSHIPSTRNAPAPKTHGPVPRTAFVQALDIHQSFNKMNFSSTLYLETVGETWIASTKNQTLFIISFKLLRIDKSLTNIYIKLNS